MLHSNDVVRQTAAKIDADKWNAACVCVCVCGKRRHKQGYCTTYFGQICDRMCMCVWVYVPGCCTHWGKDFNPPLFVQCCKNLFMPKY